MSSSDSDARSRPERLINLLIMLLVKDRFVSKEKIRTVLYDEPAGPAFDRMFDRDKELLRELGVPIETGHQDVWFEDEPGYRIRSEAFALPTIELTADEAAVVSLAAKVWQHATMAEATTQAIRKLQPVMTDDDAGDVLLPALESAVINADEPAFDAVWSATHQRRTLTFDYLTSGATVATRRRVEPWGLVRQSGRWYLVGHDTDRQAERVFRLSRISGAVRVGREAEAFQVPDDVDLQGLTRGVAGTTESITARLLVRHGKGWGLRRDAESPELDVTGPDTRSAWDRIVVTGAPDALLEQVLGHGADVLVEAPPILREGVVTRLRVLASTDTEGAA